MRQSTISLILIFFSSLFLSAQQDQNSPQQNTPETVNKNNIEIKVNPIGLLFAGVQAEAEFPVNEALSVGAHIIAGEGTFILSGKVKYFFNPKRGVDRFYIGAQGGVYNFHFEDLSPGIGFDAGYKFVSKDRVVIDLTLGAVRISAKRRFFRNNVEFIPSLTVGYRF